MTEQETLKLHVLIRKKYNLLNETYDLTKHVAESIDRKDQVTLVRFLSEREEALRQLTLLKEEIDASYGNEAKPERKRIKALIQGKGEGNDNKEEALRKQAISTRELYDKVVELDKRVNVRIAGEDSVYRHPR